MEVKFDIDDFHFHCSSLVVLVILPGHKLMLINPVCCRCDSLLLTHISETKSYRANLMG